MSQYLPLVRVSRCTSPLTKDVHHLFKALVAVHGLWRRSCSNHVLTLTRWLAVLGCLLACYRVLKNRLLNLRIHREIIPVRPSSSPSFQHLTLRWRIGQSSETDVGASRLAKLQTCLECHQLFKNLPHPPPPPFRDLIQDITWHLVVMSPQPLLTGGCLSAFLTLLSC